MFGSWSRDRRRRADRVRRLRYLSECQLKIKVAEYFNHDTMKTAAENFANSVIDDLQARYLAQDTPDLSDLMARGFEYVQGASRTRSARAASRPTGWLRSSRVR